MSRPTPSDAERLGTSVAKLNEILGKDIGNRNKWHEVDRIGNYFNRIVIFRSGHLHSATRVFGRTRETSRLTQGFSFSTL